MSVLSLGSYDHKFCHQKLKVWVPKVKWLITEINRIFLGLQSDFGQIQTQFTPQNWEPEDFCSSTLSELMLTFPKHFTSLFFNVSENKQLSHCNRYKETKLIIGFHKFGKPWKESVTWYTKHNYYLAYLLHTLSTKLNCVILILLIA